MWNSHKKMMDAWPAASFEERIKDCFMMLYLHGAIVESEREMVMARIMRKIEERKKEERT